ncbi:DNA-3-methyladenine glycosylase I [Pseudogracilibacillus auburnensis]|uniref:DNA-3-methyladenine glycosylase I n=1 Tax=Pseudogracilibacillus auburnensis TaxID=1494959 RepID=UPI001A95BA5B|nr:DNA-3-methyladenine glycosylase I [Pseudogracilibacillus auburnensis]MBO1002290.1 DNA-3-methyladenine glycosylase I [Pseudogracilibacillus auburnensis]
MEKNRCAWVTDDPLYVKYHDEEWGSLERFTDDHYLFEMLTLEGAQAGLSWITILKRRENYREAFDQFDPTIVANYGEDEKTLLLQNEGIIRNRRKIESTIKNADAFLRVQAEFGSFHAFLWEFIGGKQIVHHWREHADVPASSEMSINLSKELKKRGFTFVGPVICYSFMQAVGMINDHTTDCFLCTK